MQYVWLAPCFGGVAVWAGCEEYEHSAGFKRNPGKISTQFFARGFAEV